MEERKDIDYSFNDFSFSTIGKAKIEGTISDDSDSIFTPNQYLLKDVKTLSGSQYGIDKTFSFRGGFTEQAQNRGRINPKGRVGRVEYKGKTYY